MDRKNEEVSHLNRIDRFFEKGVEEVINELNNMARQKTYVFRGYSKRTELLPKIIRDADYSKYEIEFLREFEKYGSQYFHASTSIDFMSYAQHYGIPTRLLDFTYNPFIALSFALFAEKGTNYKAENEEEKDYYFIGCVNYKDNIIIDSLSLNKSLFPSGSIYLDSLYERSMVIINCANNNGKASGYCIKEFEEYTNDNKILFFNPNNSNQRITVQQGMFMFPLTLNRKEHMSLIDGQLFVLKIHKRLRNDLLSYLDTIGFNTYRLMPDLMSVCEAVTRNVKRNHTIEKESDKKRRL